MGKINSFLEFLITDYASAEHKRIRSCGYTAAIQTDRPKGTETGQKEPSIGMAIWKEIKKKEPKALELADPR